MRLDRLACPIRHFPSNSQCSDRSCCLARRSREGVQELHELGPLIISAVAHRVGLAWALRRWEAWAWDPRRNHSNHSQYHSSQGRQQPPPIKLKAKIPLLIWLGYFDRVSRMLWTLNIESILLRICRLDVPVLFEYV